jgi:RimJ/RimL family protein N-acetyltransferase
MLEAAKYFATEMLPNGRRIEIRALRPDDRDGLIEAVDHASSQSLYRRFFGAKRYFTEKEIRFFVNVDFVDHVALVAVVEENGHPAIVGGGRYIVTAPGTAEVAFMVVDRYQGQGIGAALMRHLTLIARAIGLHELTAEVLSSNKGMLKVFEKSGLPLSAKTEAAITHVSLRLT